MKLDHFRSLCGRQLNFVAQALLPVHRQSHEAHRGHEEARPSKISWIAGALACACEINTALSCHPDRSRSDARPGPHCVPVLRAMGREPGAHRARFWRLLRCSLLTRACLVLTWIQAPLGATTG